MVLFGHLIMIRYNHISNDLETVIDDGANNQYHEDENETIYDKKEDKDTK